MRSKRKALVHQTIDSIPAGIYFTARDVVALMKRSGHGIRALTPRPWVSSCPGATMSAATACRAITIADSGRG